MNKYAGSIRLFLIICVAVSLPLHAAGEWSMIKNSGGIKVYERPVPGTGLVEYLGVTTIDAKMEVVGEVLRDVPRFNQWLPDCHSAQVRKMFSRNDMVIYLVLKPPVIRERDIVLKNKTVYDYENGKATITFAATDEVKVPIHNRKVRITVMTGAYEMEYLGRNKTKFIYRLTVDPAGDIPRKIAYAVMGGYPYNTLRGLKKMAAAGRYADAARGGDEEKQINLRADSEAAVRKILANRLLKYVRDRASLGAIIAADREVIKSIVSSGGSYAEVEKASMNLYFRYAERLVPDKAGFEKLKKNKKLISEITDLIVTDCGATDVKVDDMVKKYNQK